MVYQRWLEGNQISVNPVDLDNGRQETRSTWIADKIKTAMQTLERSRTKIFNNEVGVDIE